MSINAHTTTTEVTRPVMRVGAAGARCRMHARLLARVSRTCVSATRRASRTALSSSPPTPWNGAWAAHLQHAGLTPDHPLGEQERKLRELRVALHLFGSAPCSDYVGERGTLASAFVARRLTEVVNEHATLARQFERFAQLGPAEQASVVSSALAAVDLALGGEEPNTAEARRVVAACAAQGRLPALADLLVEPGWRQALRATLEAASDLEAFVHSEWAAGDVAIYPAQHQVFRALNECPIDAVRVIIVGQDPYHGAGQACGLAFSLPPGQLAQPSSLRNILGEVASDCGVPAPNRGGDLSPWTRQGVLLLNTVLTVRQGAAHSHAGKGWEALTDAVLSAASAHATARGRRLVVLLWGAHARAKAPLLSTHTVLEAPHPSGLSAHRGFIGCRHFSAANATLEAQGMAPIDWRVGS